MINCNEIGITIYLFDDNMHVVHVMRIIIFMIECMHLVHVTRLLIFYFVERNDRRDY